MINNFQDFQKFGQTGLDGTMRMMGEWSKGWQTLAVEMSDYTKRAFEDGTSTLEKLMAAKSMEQAIEIQTSYVKRSYENYLQQMTKMGNIYQSLAQDAYKPLERVLPAGR